MPACSRQDKSSVRREALAAPTGRPDHRSTDMREGPGFALLLAAAGIVSETSCDADLRRVLEVRRDGSLFVEEVGVLRLQGVDPPAAGEPRAALERRLQRLTEERGFRVSLEGGRRGRARVGFLHRPGRPRSVNEELLEAGLAFFRTRTKRSAEQAALLGAALRAKTAGRGVWQDVLRRSGPPPLQRGASLGLYYKEERLKYHEQLDRVAAVGADWVQLLLTLFVDNAGSSEIQSDPARTVTDARLRETIGYAKKRGLRVSLLPIILIREAEDDDWRGTLRPSDPGRFWASYDDFLCHYLDLARETGVELVSVGSELCSLERQRDVWSRLIQNARGRYGGWLTYSANWDHYDVPRFWHLLDQVGMTAYFELTNDKNPSRRELEAAWRRVRGEIEAVSRKLGRQVVLTELGYASQNGANTAPWNYYLAQDDIDLQEQAECWRAFASVMGDADCLRGVYVFDFFEDGGPHDHTYAIWGKPAWEVVKKYLAAFGKR